MPLSDLSIRNAKPRAKPYKLSDSAGLYLQVMPTGAKLWRMKYRILGREKKLSFGKYPDVSLKKARDDRDAARSLLADGGDPSVEKKREAHARQLSADTTFLALADEYIDKCAEDGLSTVTTTKAKWLVSCLGRDIWERPIADIQPFELLGAVRKIEKAGKRETAKRALSLCSRIFRYAVATGRADRDITPDLRGALKAPRVKHYAALLHPAQVGGLLRAIDEFDGQPATKWALKLAPHVFVRPGELRQAEWSEIDLDKSVWRIPGERMKMKREHVVPLSSQSVEILTEAKSVTGRGKFVFPAMTTKLRPMSENTLNAALRRMGYSADEMTSHGFRSTASTLLNESGLWSPDAIERALAHGEANGLRAAYHRGAYWDERVRMAQWWSDYLDGLRRSAAH